MKRQTKEALRLVVEKARRLHDGLYLRQVKEQGGTNLTYSLKRQETGPDSTITIDYKHPDDDATDALVLTFRFFILDKEMAAFRWLAKHVMDDSGLSDEWKQGFTEVRDDFNTFLDSSSNIVERLIAPVLNGKPGEVQIVSEMQPTNREIMDIFINGGLAHAEPRKRQVFERWRANPLVFPWLQAQFDHIVMIGLHAIIRVGALSDHELNAQRPE